MGEGKPKRQIARGLFDNPLALLNLAQSRADELRIQLAYCSSDCWIAVFDFAMAINALRDWVKALRPELESQLNTLLADKAIAACRDIANAGKHIHLEYSPTAVELVRTGEVPLGTLNAYGNPEQRIWRLAVVLADDTSRYMEDIADDAVGLWLQFFERYGIE